MLRPATPLSVLFFLAFVLLLLSTLSTPIIGAIPLGSYQGYNFGVFGYCKGSECSPIAVGYSTEGLFTGDDFSLPASTRNSLSSILIVHPVAALLTLVCFGLAVAAHFHGPSSSPRYLLALLIFSVPTLLVTLLAFLVDILLFVPHMQWGGWIVLAAVILIVASSVVTCAMRRTLVSRKARKKRIAENTDMNGIDYYQNLQQTRMMNDSALPRADSPPPMSTSTAADKHMPQYASFEMKDNSNNGHSRDGDPGMGAMGAMDDRAPLNPNRDPSIRSAGSGRRPYMNSEDAPPMPRPSMDSNGRPRRPDRDQYGNVMYGDMPPPPALRSQGSQSSMGSQGSRGRGRGGYGPPPRGYGAPRGGYPPPRGGYGQRGSYRGGPPPPGWNGRGRGGYGPPPGMRGGPPPPRPGPPPGYANDAYYGAAPVPVSNPRSGPSPMMDQRPQPHDEFVAGPPVPIGQAIEMDERTGTPGQSPRHDNFSTSYGLRDSDADVRGMVGLQQEQQERRPSPRRRESERSSGQRSPTSIYSNEAYIPPRSIWVPQSESREQQRPQASSPLSTMETPHSSQPYNSTGMPSSRTHPLSPIMASPASPIVNRHRRAGSEPYYEDVDPRFAVEEPSDDGFRNDDNNNNNNSFPTALTPGAQPSYHPHQRMPPPPHNPDYLHPPSYAAGAGANHTHDPHSERQLPLDYDEGPSPGGGSSERASEASHFTSISERPVNPNWRPDGSQYGGGGTSAAAVQRKREDVLLAGNPDFSIPGMGPARGTRPGERGGRGGGMGPGAASNVGAGLTPVGRYPTDF
ncbi:hypothetical protein LTR37_010427 [Vermiconidia calcicola]|uniref:Uncharacterized protein n=1 Tax=Vermiconidia calcicola TaxID=1690605 RepID=A0ACC3N4Z7_9PEZI|nr:hypothetical protein LTR37_010427 [Vermiconidia calcicola]